MALGKNLKKQQLIPNQPGETGTSKSTKRTGTKNENTRKAKVGTKSTDKKTRKDVASVLQKPETRKSKSIITTDEKKAQKINIPVAKKPSNLISEEEYNERQRLKSKFDDELQKHIGKKIHLIVFALLRFDYAFTRDLTVELYARPFISAAQYDEFKQVADPMASDYGDRYVDLVTERVAGGSLSDVDRDGTTEFINDPNFNFKQFRSNAVLRWEFRPGSTLFVVWSHGRQHSDQTGEFYFGENVSTLFEEPADDILMVKFNYWLNPTDKFKA